ncbi:MAG: hypothetical protein ACOC9P_00440 [bacterium]
MPHHRILLRHVCAFMLLVVARPGFAAEALLPQVRTAYHSGERIELAVTGLEEGASAALNIEPVEGEAASRLTFDITGEPGSELIELPPHTLVPGEYHVTVSHGEEQGDAVTLRIARGVPRSTMYFSQTGRATAEAGANFSLSNAFNFGLRTRDGEAAQDVRRLSRGMQIHEDLIARDMPDLVYMYWTGYITHKPWGINKSWAADHMTRNMRRFNFHVAQRLRRFGHNIMMVGAIDEPGLSWGRTPAGGSASGFPNWDSRDWYESRGWDFTNDPASRPDDDWLKYMEIRTAILGEQIGQARDDIQRVWPEAIFSTDLYAPHAITDGTDPWNQQRANDIPSTHVFADYGHGKLGVLASLYIEKSHDPLAKLAHAMNGQLFGKAMDHPRPLRAFQLMRNVMLAAGLESNWWLNYHALNKGEDEQGRTGNELMNANLRRVNEPALRYGPLFVEMVPDAHDVAVLWSWTELAMRSKSITAQAAHAEQGEQPTLMIADLPEDAYNEQGEVEVNAYQVGSNYKGEIVTAATAINRAGYPVHVMHERLLATDVLDRYKVLVLVGQTHALPEKARAAIERFTEAGGQVIVDEKTTVELPGALTTEANVADHSYRWRPHFQRLKQLEEGSPKTREASYYQTNHYAEDFSREASGAFKATLEQTGARPVMRTDDVELACERHTAGEGSLLLVINGREELPQIEPTEAYPIWNYAPHETRYQLPAIDADSVVYKIEGAEWDRVERVREPAGVQSESFEAGEMKLYLVAPREPAGLTLTAQLENGELRLDAALDGVEMPWPMTVRVVDPSDATIVELHRATDAAGRYRETLSIGRNAPAGTYTVRITSPVADLTAQAEIDAQPDPIAPRRIDDAARVFDAETIRAFLRDRPALTVALGDDAQRPVAERLAAALREAGLDVSIEAERNVWRKALYPRVWDPYLAVYEPTDEAEAQANIDEDQIERRLTVVSDHYGIPTVRTDGGDPVEGNWREQGTLLTVTGDGFIDINGPETFYRAGCELLVQQRGRLKPLNAAKTQVKASESVRATWSRPWKRLRTYTGAHNLVPQLPEAYRVDEHVILLGDSTRSELVRALQASELLPQVVDEKYPGRGKALVQFAWHPFTLGHHAIYLGSVDTEGLNAAIDSFLELTE